LNIIIVVSDLGIGGGQKAAIILANALSENHSVCFFDVKPELRNSRNVAEINEKVVLLNYKPGAVPVFFVRIINSFLYRLGINREYKNRWFENKRKKYFRTEVIKRNINIINSHICWADFFIADVITKLGAKWVVTMHGCYDRDYLTDNRNEWFRLKAEKVFGTSDAVVYLTGKNLEVFNHVSTGKEIIKRKIYNGFLFINPGKKAERNEFGISETAFVFAVISRAEIQKGWEEAILATIQLRQDCNSEVHLMLMGDGRDLQSLKNKYSLPFVHFAGHVNNVAEIIPMINVGLLPSKAECESLPYSIMEFLSAGKPVIASAVGEIPSMLQCGDIIAGQLIEQIEGEISIAELLKKMHEYYTNKALYEKHAASAKIMVTQFTIENAVNNYEILFNEVINNDANNRT